MAACYGVYALPFVTITISSLADPTMREGKISVALTRRHSVRLKRLTEIREKQHAQTSNALGRFRAPCVKSYSTRIISSLEGRNQGV